VTGALEALQACQHEEMDAAGAAYANSGYVVAELGRPVHPETYSDDFARMRRQARPHRGRQPGQLPGHAEARRTGRHQ